MNRNQRIAQQLGMSHGAANNRLKKALLFKYVWMADENICHVCGGDIESPEDFSIEHILPWEGRDPELFWSLENITFSHIQCNRPHVQSGPDWNSKGGPPNKKTCPGGMSWCGCCEMCLPRERFNLDRSAWHGLQSTCKPCRSEARRRYKNGTLAESG